MADIVSSGKRSAMMSGIGGTNTKPEILLRKALFSRGFRYRLHDRRLPGKPDLVFAGKRAVIFVDGCFWHGHDCHLFKWPSTRPAFWRTKIESNRARDRQVTHALTGLGWRQARIRECALKGKTRRPFTEVVDMCAEWLQSQNHHLDIPGVRVRVRCPD